MRKTLIIHIQSPMQSWGIGSRYERRGAGSAPSKSAICGMACAAFGAARQSELEERIVAAFNRMKMTSFCLQSGKVLSDYHTVQNFMRAKGTIERSDAVQTYRQYWTDKQYVVLLDGEDVSFLQELRSALTNPRWGVWFGRKCCIPSAPLIQEDLLEPGAARDAALAGCNHDAVEICEEVDTFAEGNDTWMDAPMGFGRVDSSGREGRVYLQRRVKVRALPIASPEAFFQFDAPV